MKSWQSFLLNATITGAMAWALILCTGAFLLRAFYLWWTSR